MNVPPSTTASLVRPEVHGHRGCRGLFPENTLPAFLHALSLGVDVLELDVIISADQQVVVSHEPWLSARLGTGPLGETIDPAHERSYNLFQLPYARIRQCATGILPHPLFPEQQLVSSYRPLLHEVVEAVEAECQRLRRPPVGYSIELKSTAATVDIFHPSPQLFVKLILAQLSTDVQARTTLLSFDLHILQAAHQLIPDIHLCLLVETTEPFTALVKQLGFVPDTFGPAVELLSPSTIQALRTTFSSLQIVPWTVNELSALRLVIGWGVDGITTDYPDRLLKLLS